VTAVERQKESNRILNLCFHGIGTPRRELEPDEDLIWIQEEQFSKILDVIANFPDVRITFDDGNASDAAIALPALRKRDLTASFFIIYQRIDEPGSLSSEDVRSLVSEGMTIGTHGMRHRHWRIVYGDELREELVEAAGAIAGVSGRPVREAACPFGSYDRRVLRALKQTAHFDRVYTVDGGAASRGAWLQSRYTVRATDTPADIERLALAPHGNAVTATVRASKSLVKRWR
jgi:peptidoglycan/xylan/chitin deacetylase (PgdA/CDA1 family)